MKAVVAGMPTVFVCTRESRPREHRGGVGSLGGGECGKSSYCFNLLSEI